MKSKVLLAVALSGLLTASVGNAALGLEGTDDGAGLQNLADNSSSNANSVMQNPGLSDTANRLAAAGTGTSAVDPTTSASGDDMSADTATGDDDY